MKVVVVGESLRSPSGFGNQMTLITRGLAKFGHDVFIVCPAAYPAMTDLPENMQEWRVSNVQDLDSIDRVLYKIEPDATILFWHTYLVSHLSRLKSAPANCSTFLWLPWEGSTLPGGAEALFNNIPKNHVIHLSEFGRDLWKDVVDSDVVIPHGVDLSVFKRETLSDEDKIALRRKWAEKLRFPLFDDSFVVLNVDRNIRHKRWDAVLYYVSKLQAKMSKRVQLIAHAKKIGDVLRVSDMVIGGYDIPKMTKLYGVKNQVVFTEFDWGNGLTSKELIELYQICDVRISTSEGEGFGIPTIEAAALGVPQILNSHTTMSELMPKDSRFLVEPAMTEVDRDCLWQVPNVEAMVERTIEFVGDPTSLNAETEKAYEHVVEKFDAALVASKFNDLVMNKNISSLTRKQCWQRYRWGYTHRAMNIMEFRDLVYAIMKFGRMKVLEVGSFDGIFLNIATDAGLDIVGIEPDNEIVGKLNPRLQQYVENQPYLSDWPKANAVVMTDNLELVWDDGQEDAVHQVISRIATSYEWAFLRFRPTYKWGLPTFGGDYAARLLEGGGSKRRHDLEILAKNHFKLFSHEIWSLNDTKVVPPELAKPPGG